MNMRRVIGLDIDEVLLGLVDGLNDFYNRRFGTGFKVEDYVTYDLEDTWGGTKEDAVRIVEDFYGSPDFLKISPVSGSQEAVARLARTSPLVSITSRPSSIREGTLSQIQRFFGRSIGDVFFNGQYGMKSHKISKASICEGNGVGSFVDDNLSVCNDLAARGIRTYLFERPWNRNEDVHPEVVRVRNWTELYEVLKSR